MYAESMSREVGSAPNMEMVDEKQTPMPSHVEEAPVTMERTNDNFEKSPMTQPDVDADEEYTFAEQRKIIHKVDRRLLIILGLMQAVSFLDRANMSNAAVAGYGLPPPPKEKRIT